MRVVFCCFLFYFLFTSSAQIPLHDYQPLNESLIPPEDINSSRSLVIIHVPDTWAEGFRGTGEWEKLGEAAHPSFVTMGIDPILYINHYDLVASTTSQIIYAELFRKREVKNLIFITRYDNGMFMLTMLPFNGTKNFISDHSPAFRVKGTKLDEVMLKTGREIRRAENDIRNFLIPEHPTFLSGLSIIEKLPLKNYPGILRRSTLAVERFAKMILPEGVGEGFKEKIDSFNMAVDKKNEELELLMQNYPYDYVMIDPMSDEDLLRNRHQFILRSIRGQAKTLREMLEYKVNPSEAGFTSTVPVMPDQTYTKRIPKNALVHKFYIKQNISKNVHTGRWDADETWQQALFNLIGNLIQSFQNRR